MGLTVVVNVVFARCLWLRTWLGGVALTARFCGFVCEAFSCVGVSVMSLLCVPGCDLTLGRVCQYVSVVKSMPRRAYRRTVCKRICVAYLKVH